jgi:hypothetical protein
MLRYLMKGPSGTTWARKEGMRCYAGFGKLGARPIGQIHGIHAMQRCSNAIKVEDLYYEPSPADFNEFRRNLSVHPWI